MALYVERTDITSNARVKEYPRSLVLQVANAPIFREAGYEPRRRTYDVPPKGKAKDCERSIYSSRCRAKTAVRDIALCNSFTHFFTLFPFTATFAWQLSVPRANNRRW